MVMLAQHVSAILRLILPDKVWILGRAGGLCRGRTLGQNFPSFCAPIVRGRVMQWGIGVTMKPWEGGGHRFALSSQHKGGRRWKKGFKRWERARDWKKECLDTLRSSVSDITGLLWDLHSAEYFHLCFEPKAIILDGWLDGFFGISLSLSGAGRSSAYSAQVLHLNHTGSTVCAKYMFGAVRAGWSCGGSLFCTIQPWEHGMVSKNWHTRELLSGQLRWGRFARMSTTNS